jgi:hypothetical protein
VDVNEDGAVDLLSGSYSRMDEDMAGLLQVLWGTKDGAFAPAEALAAENGKPLILPGEDDVDRICTRPCAADLDGDGKLDLVIGNFRGTFAFVHGEGRGKFAAEATWIESQGKKLAVGNHGDPFLVDWDGDGDLDLLSGSAEGGVFLFTNQGSKSRPEFAQPVTLIEPAGYVENNELGDAHLAGPSDSTRVVADDLNGDGKLDLLVGDNVTLYYAVEGVSDAVAKQKLAAWREAMKNIKEENYQDEYERIEKERDQFVLEERTGFVWVYYQKAQETAQR